MFESTSRNNIWTTTYFEPKLVEPFFRSRQQIRQFQLYYMCFEQHRNQHKQTSTRPDKRQSIICNKANQSNGLLPFMCLYAFRVSKVWTGMCAAALLPFITLRPLMIMMMIVVVVDDDDVVVVDDGCHHHWLQCAYRFAKEDNDRKLY
ncbi:hypothetical protein BLOT_003317 [Blomia tropicalis]|nr:hypothetical protein BLOT_003317 [Blomia tropicalis]